MFEQSLRPAKYTCLLSKLHTAYFTKNESTQRPDHVKRLRISWRHVRPPRNFQSISSHPFHVNADKVLIAVSDHRLKHLNEFSLKDISKNEGTLVKLQSSVLRQFMTVILVKSHGFKFVKDHSVQQRVMALLATKANVETQVRRLKKP